MKINTVVEALQNMIDSSEDLLTDEVYVEALKFALQCVKEKQLMTIVKTGDDVWFIGENNQIQLHGKVYDTDIYCFNETLHITFFAHLDNGEIETFGPEDIGNTVVLKEESL